MDHDQHHQQPTHYSNMKKSLKFVPLFTYRVLYPGIVLHLSLSLDWFLDQNLALLDLVAAVPIYPPPSNSDGHDRDDSLLAPLLLNNIHYANFGCLGRIIKLNQITIGNNKAVDLFIQGISRLRIHQLIPKSTSSAHPFISAVVDVLLDTEISMDDKEGKSMESTLRQQTAELVSLNGSMSTSLTHHVHQLIKSTSISQLTYILSNLLNLPTHQRIVILSLDTKDRVIQSIFALQSQLDSLHANLNRSTEPKSRKHRYSTHREFNQLGAPDSASNEVELLIQKLDQSSYPSLVSTHIRKDLKRLQTMSPNMTEYHMLMNYADVMLDLPWNRLTTDRIDLVHAQKQMDSDHFGLNDVKKRVIEYLAVRKLNDSLKGPILCLHGPPGTGKTSIAKSVAESMNRKFERIALGGVRDEAEIRGHRRTYVGAMPGIIIQALKRCGSRNPVIILDEVDKLGRDILRGDPSSALLEVLDPEQNSRFKDHYIQLEFDLSQVLFIATCNETATIPKPLLDRMEVIDIHGYTPGEKRAIAKNKLLPKQLISNGLTNEGIELSDQALDYIIMHYTHEAGVRSLERCLGTICRSVAVDHVRVLDQQPSSSADDRHPTKLNSHAKNRVLNEKEIGVILGPNKYDLDSGLKQMVPGVAQGLAWTGTGTGVVMIIETSKYPGKGNVQLTGQLGSVLQESAALALTWLRTHAYELGLVSTKEQLLWSDQDIHIHLPAGAIKKDGPSAGVTLVTALTSLAMGIPIRPGVAITGEISLRGDIHPVGGIKEKAVAAYIAGIPTILIPVQNRKDEPTIPEEVRQALRIVYCEHLFQVLHEVLDSAILSSLTQQLKGAARASAPGREQVCGPFILESKL